MRVIETISELRRHLAELRGKGRRVGFVPTMGYLHDGHLSLVRTAKNNGCFPVVMSIFVNPLQFGPQEDFERYPRDLERDRRLAEAAGVDVLFVPSTEEMYPRPIRTRVSVRDVTDRLCGRSRPGHFDGVATVVTKLFQIVQPDQAFFGAKDYQQVQVVRIMTEDLNMPVEIVACPIYREPDGLAMSSRNVYLSPEERKQASVLYEALRDAEERVRNGERKGAVIVQAAREKIASRPLARIDYISLVDADTLEDVESIDKPTLLALAVFFGKTRLIDNTVLIPTTIGR
jgi:pantoate--beta-alanine ligase